MYVLRLCIYTFGVVYAGLNVWDPNVKLIIQRVDYSKEVLEDPDVANKPRGLVREALENPD